MNESNSRLTEIARRLRQLILNCTTEAGSGHPTSSLSAVELMAALMFGVDTEGSPFFRFDADTLRRAAEETGLLITVEDHSPNGGIGETVASAVTGIACPVHILAVGRVPRSGTPEELLAFEGINRQAVVNTVQALLSLR